jgi:hypothetical protein
LLRSMEHEPAGPKVVLLSTLPGWLAIVLGFPDGMRRNRVLETDHRKKMQWA